jgi:AsmA family protein
MIVRRGLICAVAVPAALLVMVALLIAALDAGYFREPLIRFFSARIGRPLHVSGALETHFFSLNPRVIAEQVQVDNPPWMPAGRTATIGKVTLILELPWFGHGFGAKKLAMDDATMYLVRDSTGRANWQVAFPMKPSEGATTMVRSLSVPNAHVELDDARRHLQFNGTVSAQDAEGTEGLRALRIQGAGELNGRPTVFEITGDPLAGASRAKPYGFSFDERSSGSRLTGRGFLLRPFNFDQLDTSFEAAGADLKDLYFLTGVKLLNTGSYRVSGKLARRGARTQFSDLAVTSGQSDVQGSASIDTSSGRPMFAGEFNSQTLRLADLGARAAGRSSLSDQDPRTGQPLLLSNAMLNLVGVRADDAALNYHALRVEVGDVELHAMAARLTIDQGVLKLWPLQAEVLDGKLTAYLMLDATKEVPAAQVDLRITGLQLGNLHRKAGRQPPFEGLMHARVTVTGEGSSLHQVAATANGTVTAVLPHGTIRAALAELSGIDLKGLGIEMTKKTEETPVRCGVASFQARKGTLTAQSLIVDTDPVLITGGGVVHLDSETLDLEFRGRPKSFRLLRVRSPLMVGGTLLHPAIHVEARHSIAQAAEAVALGVLLTPLASVLAFVDPGLAKDADCAALLATAQHDDQRARVITAAH